MDAPITLSRNIGKTLWRGYNASETDEHINADFLRRYGVLPGEIQRNPGVSTVLALVPTECQVGEWSGVVEENRP